MGDMGERIASGLAVGGKTRRLVLAGRSPRTLADITATTATIADCVVTPTLVDATRRDDVAELLDRFEPDLVVQCASLRSPWELTGREDAAARALAAAGLGLRLPYQLPVLLSVMRAAQDAGYTGPVANLSFPDATGPVLRGLDLAPTTGLGNAGMILLRVRAALRAAQPGQDPPLIRILAQHWQDGPSMRGAEPADPAARCQVFLGEDGRRADELAYRAPGIEPGLRHNAVTTAASVPVLEALLPGAAPVRWSVPAPGGLPGGYPVRVADGAVTLDLPPGVTAQEAVAFNERHAAGDGIERIDADGTVHFTAAAREAVAGIDPDLAAPLPVTDDAHLAARAAALDAVLR
jgi:hypothetical protein